MTDAELPIQQFTHSIKIEQSAYGARVTVHVNADTALDAMDQAVKLYKATRLELFKENETVAPIEVRKNGVKV